MPEDHSYEREFRRLVDRFYRPVAQFFTNRGYPPADIPDLTQETFLKVYRGLDGYRGEASEATWLFTIATNTWRNALRSRAAAKRATEYSLEDNSRNVTHSQFRDAAPDPLDAALDEEKSELLRAAIDELPDRMRRCVHLRVAQDLKYREIAAIMQVSIQTVRSQLHEARKRLKDRLGDYFEELD